MPNLPSPTDDFNDRFFNEMHIVLSVLDIASENEDVRPDVMDLILTARAHAQAMVEPARWLLRQYEDSLRREKVLEYALNLALDIGREKNYDEI